jgi:hypothetical protein
MITSPDLSYCANSRAKQSGKTPFEELMLIFVEMLARVKLEAELEAPFEVAKRFWREDAESDEALAEAYDASRSYDDSLIAGEEASLERRQAYAVGVVLYPRPANEADEDLTKLAELFIVCFYQDSGSLIELSPKA